MARQKNLSHIWLGKKILPMKWVGKKNLRHAPANPFMNGFARRAVNLRGPGIGGDARLPSKRKIDARRERENQRRRAEIACRAPVPQRVPKGLRETWGDFLGRLRELFSQDLVSSEETRSCEKSSRSRPRKKTSVFLIC